MTLGRCRARLTAACWLRRWQSTAASTVPLVSPALLSRARALAAEHSELSKKLERQYDNQIAKKTGSLNHVASAFAKWEAANASISELQNLIADPKSDNELRSLAEEEIASTTEDLASLSKQLQTSLVPPHPFASLPCLIELRPGAGGDEAALFAGDLLRMYAAYCKSQSLPCNILKLDTEPSGSTEPKVLEAVLEIDRTGAYEHFRCEAGVHRVQRIPATEAKGRTHTSAVSVLVLPSFPENSPNDGNGEAGGEGGSEDVNVDDPSSDYFVHPSDVRVETMRARGAGGQHVNMTDSAVRLTHLPTNTVVSMQDQRSQLKNRQKAWQILRAKLAQARRDAREEEMAKLRVGVIGVAKMGRGDKIRTYNWSQQRVTDHRCGVSVWGLDEVIAGGGGLSTIMEGVRDWLKSRDLEALVQEEKEGERSSAATVAATNDQRGKR